MPLLLVVIHSQLSKYSSFHQNRNNQQLIFTGGADIQRESDEYIQKHGELSTGECCVTGPGKLPCIHIIHAVGPMWRGGEDGEAKELKSAIVNSIKKAEELDAPSLAFPPISSGIFGYPNNL